MLIIPEAILLDSLRKGLKLIRDDYTTNQGNPPTTLLYKILFGNSVQRYDLFEQAKKVFIADENDPRHLDVNLFFNAKRASIPTIHITLPSEDEKDNALGMSGGFQQPVFSPDGSEFNQVFNRRYNATYNIIVTSDNTLEVVLIYHFMRSFLISLNSHLSLSGLENIKMGGGDLNINSEIVPINVFVRGIKFNFQYNVIGIELQSKDNLAFAVLANSVPLQI
jgi:hypothetical protein